MELLELDKTKLSVPFPGCHLPHLQVLNKYCDDCFIHLVGRWLRLKVGSPAQGSQPSTDKLQRNPWQRAFLAQLLCFKAVSTSLKPQRQHPIDFSSIFFENLTKNVHCKFILGDYFEGCSLPLMYY